MPLSTDEKLLQLSRDVIDAFDKADGGVHPGFRPAHAKGVLLTGTFTPSSEAASLTRAPHILAQFHAGLGARIRLRGSSQRGGQ